MPPLLLHDLDELEQVLLETEHEAPHLVCEIFADLLLSVKVDLLEEEH